MSSIKILLVENHRDTRDYLQRFLESEGYEVQCAEGMQSALKSAAAIPVQILISDIGLPDGDGWQLMELLQSSTPVAYGIAMSGYASPADQSRSRAVGYRHHLIKPFLPEELTDVLAEAAVSLSGE